MVLQSAKVMRGNGISVLFKSPQRSLASSALCDRRCVEDKKTLAVNEEEASQRMWQCQCPDLGLLSLQSSENKLPNLWYFVIVAEWTETVSVSNYRLANVLNFYLITKFGDSVSPLLWLPTSRGGKNPKSLVEFLTQ